MIRRLAAAAGLLCIAGTASAQTLFTYGRDTVTASEFLTAWKKNNAGKPVGALNDYLDLYIASRLKIREAKRLGYDTLPQMVTDLQNLREQLMPTYLNELAGVDALVREAQQRSKKNIHLSHLFIAVRPGSDTSLAWKRAQEAYAQLQKGTPFAAVARQYSDDPSVKDNGGDLGQVGVFTLPYELENLAWSTPAGKHTAIYRSRAGYHILKNNGERPDPGTFHGAQVLLAFPPGATEAEKAVVKKRADSIYNRLLKGDDIGKLAERFSNDVVSAANKGELPDINAGQFDPLFEEKIFALAKDGAITQPFRTEHGWHIVKRLSLKPRAASDSTAALQAFRERVEASDRMNTVRESLVAGIRSKAGYRELNFSRPDLVLYTDSLLEYKKPARTLAVNSATPLLQIGDATLTGADWIAYASTNRFRNDGSGTKPFDALWKEFGEASSVNVYKANLERYNPAFRAQMDEFRDGNLFFEIMQREVWGPAQADTLGLEKFYAQHHDRYIWKQSADAVLFYAPDAATAKAARAALLKKPSAWRTAMAAFDDKVAIDSNRFELDQVPNPGKIALKPGAVTEPLVNATDGSASFGLVLALHPASQPRTFAEARGQVITDYQKELEDRWVNTLRAKYPVTINQPALLELMKGK
jgi:peptidyl-prolyl cis-trans isomerase SurA